MFTPPYLELDGDAVSKLDVVIEAVDAEISTSFPKDVDEIVWSFLVVFDECQKLVWSFLVVLDENDTGSSPCDDELDNVAGVAGNE